MSKLLESIKKHEGFRGDVYKDSLGLDTIGYGTLLPLSKYEASLLLEHRLNAKIEELKQKEPFIKELPQEVQDIVIEMAYQLGVNGVLNFKKMWKALKKGNYKEAAKEGLDSRWAIQTPNRAKELMTKLSNI